MLRSDDTAEKFSGCNEALKSHFAEYQSKKDDINANGDLVVGGATGTCLTALRYLHTDQSEVCPMPLPPPLEDITVDSDDFNLFTLGDWGPSPPGFHGCACSLVSANECRWTMFNELSLAPSICSDAQHAQENNDAGPLVADAMAKYAQDKKPVAVVSLGDNFYMGGIPTPFNHARSPDDMTEDFAFKTTWSDRYLQNSHGSGLNVPWLAIFGNHDYGGAGCQADWQVQIDFTKKDASKLWRMPYQYYKQRIHAPSYSMDIFMMEVNADDFEGSGEHGICSQKYCSDGPGKGNEAACRDRSRKRDAQMFQWLEEEMQKSVDEGIHWRLVAGHFSDGPNQNHTANAIGKKYGAAFYIGGHTHKMMVPFNHGSGHVLPNEIPVFCSGAGGGYEKGGDGDFYGFGNLAVTKDKIEITIVDTEGTERPPYTVDYKAPPSPPPAGVENQYV